MGLVAVTVVGVGIQAVAHAKEEMEDVEGDAVSAPPCSDGVTMPWAAVDSGGS